MPLGHLFYPSGAYTHGMTTVRRAKELTISRWINAAIGVAGLSIAFGGRSIAQQFDIAPYPLWGIGAAVFLTALLFQSFLFQPPSPVTTAKQLADRQHQRLYHVTLAALGTWVYVLGATLVWIQPYSLFLAFGGSLMVLGGLAGVRGGLPLLRAARFSQNDPSLTNLHATASQSISYRNAYLFGLQAAVVLALLASWNVIELHASTLGFAITATMVLAQVTTLAWREWANGAG